MIVPAVGKVSAAIGGQFRMRGTIDSRSSTLLYRLAEEFNADAEYRTEQTPIACDICQYNRRLSNTMWVKSLAQRQVLIVIMQCNFYYYFL